MCELGAKKSSYHWMDHWKSVHWWPNQLVTKSIESLACVWSEREKQKPVCVFFFSFSWKRLCEGTLLHSLCQVKGRLNIASNILPLGQATFGRQFYPVTGYITGRESERERERERYIWDCHQRPNQDKWSQRRVSLWRRFGMRRKVKDGEGKEEEETVSHFSWSRTRWSKSFTSSVTFTS